MRVGVIVTVGVCVDVSVGVIVIVGVTDGVGGPIAYATVLLGHLKIICSSVLYKITVVAVSGTNTFTPLPVVKLVYVTFIALFPLSANVAKLDGPIAS